MKTDLFSIHLGNRYFVSSATIGNVRGKAFVGTKFANFPVCSLIRGRIKLTNLLRITADFSIQKLRFFIIKLQVNNNLKRDYLNINSDLLGIENVLFLVITGGKYYFEPIQNKLECIGREIDKRIQIINLEQEIWIYPFE
ncbi:hypothetical protein [Chryseobacterium sp. JUb7]|uniref:hypothetical protein n=1 Tax=Chryseobacterium sp. JUb7 TaxID=2940599 RepID=UPI0021684D7A|nr:hypothetical protein [Chryseobacterium sp. JUb7]MCS3531939.1 hypothetical protein [Chryseobacterium sp. JUb7]